MGSGPIRDQLGDLHDHELDVARVHAEAEAVERLERAYAGLQRRMDRIAAMEATMAPGAAVAVSPGQLRLAAG